MKLLKIIQEGLNQKEFGHFKGILADVRSFQESIYKSINIRNPSVVPISMFKSNGMIKFNQLMKHLDGNPDRNYISTTIVYQNSTISNFAQSLYWACGEYIHEDPNRKYYISDYAVKSIVNNLMELLMWSKQF